MLIKYQYHSSLNKEAIGNSWGNTHIHTERNKYKHTTKHKESKCPKQFWKKKDELLGLKINSKL